MKYLLLILSISFGIMAFSTSKNDLKNNSENFRNSQNLESKKYKCMIQMKNYTGENAYVIVSLLNEKGEYQKTLAVQGDDDEWYSDITEWWSFQGKIRTDIDAITGETISAGNRIVISFEIAETLLNKGYKVRFETAVEDQEYYKDDVEFELISEELNIKNKSEIKQEIKKEIKKEGKGFIKYVRLIPQ
ncbi:DUF2271 domain-containing protein [Tenacibaculum piscium]|uniref:DUF2271 domain-containing protein n=1 Tax=Tenacibaculum piscium TaxID=1458515 RepID=UPI001F2F3C27|nr:DUF2271 domain-containing protein [Tenacibaculum piscium]